MGGKARGRGRGSQRKIPDVLCPLWAIHEFLEEFWHLPHNIVYVSSEVILPGSRYMWMRLKLSVGILFVQAKLSVI